MNAAIIKGADVRQIVKPIEGKVVGFQIDQETGSRLIQVEYVGEDGSIGSRYFSDGELEVIPAAEETPATN